LRRALALDGRALYQAVEKRREDGPMQGARSIATEKTSEARFGEGGYRRSRSSYAAEANTAQHSRWPTEVVFQQPGT